MTERERLTTDRELIFLREAITLNSRTKDDLRRAYNRIFDRLQKYEVGDEIGMLLRLPCKVGDKVYEVIYDCVPKKWQITEDTIAEVGTKGFFVNWDGSYEFMPYSEIGKTVFLTREEAEKALKEREENA